MAQILKGQTFNNGDQVTGTTLNQLVDAATLLTGAITEQGVFTGPINSLDLLLIYDQSTNSLRKCNINDILSSGIAMTTPTIIGSVGADITLTPASGYAFSVVGNQTISGTLGVTGNTTIGGTLSVTGSYNDINLGTGKNVTLSSAPVTSMQAANKGYVDGTLSAASNGYVKLPNGLIIQWGFDSTSFGNTTTFPIAFPNNCFNVSVTLNTSVNSTQSGVAIYCAIYSKTTTGFTTQGIGWNSASVSGKYWFAIGN